MKKKKKKKKERKKNTWKTFSETLFCISFTSNSCLALYGSFMSKQILLMCRFLFVKSNSLFDFLGTITQWLKYRWCRLDDFVFQAT